MLLPLKYIVFLTLLRYCSCEIVQNWEMRGNVCTTDIGKFCPKIKRPIEVMACLEHHDKELSKECAHAIRKCPIYKCADDILKFCPDAQSSAEIVACLLKHRSELSQKCASEDGVNDHPAKRAHFRAEHPCFSDEQALCQKESFLDTVLCLKDDLNKDALTKRCSKTVNHCPIFMCVDIAQKACPEVASMDELRSCIEVNAPKCINKMAPIHDPLSGSCKNEIKQYCRDSNSRSVSLYQCLKSHEDDLSESCEDAVDDHFEHKCDGDIKTHCSQHIGEKLMQCLKQLQNPTKKCKKAITQNGNILRYGFRVGNSVLANNGHADVQEHINDGHAMLILLISSLVAITVTLAAFLYAFRRSPVSQDDATTSLVPSSPATEYVRI
uniref:FZ domain-containing protein n=1 Tax=Spongospora subterranea TaxID=70186 RepID=A0A0H5R516_9EUKA|eukprot:CRZ09238.1 hypothetical protein [Spongospora subterranea]